MVLGDVGDNGASGDSGPTGNTGGTKGVRTRGAIKSAKVKSAKVKQKKLEVGAGAKIAQDIGIDPNSMDFWQSEPTGMIYINYVGQEQADMIISAGKREEAKEGFMEELTVGN